jgi:hypothetical protein
MGLLSCFAPGQQEATDRLSQEVQELKVALASAQKHVTQLQADRSQLLHDLASRPITPSKHDAATEMATLSVGVQVKPPVTLESRIPRPTSEDVKEADGSKVPAKTRIPAPPIAVPHAAVTGAAAEPEVARSPSPSRSACRSPCHSPPHSPTRSARNLLASEPAAAAAAGEAREAPLSAAASPRGVQLAVGALRAPSLPDTAALASPKATSNEHHSTAAAGSAQRAEVVQQQLKVAEAFRASVEAELRDARFANTNLQTQMLSLQTKFEKTVEGQLREVERLMKLRKEGQDAHEQALQQVAALKHQLELQGLACTSAQREAAAAAKNAAEQEQRVQQAQAEEARVREELAGCVAQLEQRGKECSELAEKLQAVQQRAQAADVRVLQLQGVAQQTDETHRAAIKQVRGDCMVFCWHQFAGDRRYSGVTMLLDATTVAAPAAGLACCKRLLCCCGTVIAGSAPAHPVCSFVTAMHPGLLLSAVCLLLLCSLRTSCGTRRPSMTQQWRRCCSSTTTTMTSNRCGCLKAAVHAWSLCYAGTTMMQNAVHRSSITCRITKQNLALATKHLLLMPLFLPAVLPQAAKRDAQP